MAKVKELKDFFEDELRDVYDAERQITKALPKMVKKASHPDLKAAFEMHLEETREQVSRLEQVFETLDLRVRGKHCAGMAGILEEGKDLMEEDGTDEALDAGYTAAAQRVEHYEITAYGTLIAWGKLLGYTEAVRLLEQNLAEEKAADKKLTTLAERTLNPAAVSATVEA